MALINSITENGLLYLFTTIAQCLAGAIALLAAFALYRLQAINSASSDLCKLLMQVFALKGAVNDELASLDALRTEGRYEEFIEKRKELLAPSLWGAQAGRVELPKLSLAEGELARLRLNMNTHRDVRSALRVALIVTGIVMTASIAATPLASFLSTRPLVAWSVVLLFTFLFVGCLRQFYALVGVALRA